MIYKKDQQHTVLIDTHVQAPISADWFTADYWHQQQAVTGTALGRETTYFVKHEAQHWVLRHYYRGGFIEKLIKDHYFYFGTQYCRSIAEFQLLHKMVQLNLPVPKPVAAHVEKKGIVYKAGLIIEQLHGYQDLSVWLKQGSLSKEAWRTIGKTIALFHLHRIDHVDLNLKNILWNGKKAYLIDFDRCKQRPWHGSWQKKNLTRLKRSFYKEQQKSAQLHWQPVHFSILMAAYQTHLN
tara:strand:- start:5287 stop:6000 length:714 start_codon:yes stop_codon:yes gene_type:complete